MFKGSNPTSCDYTFLFSIFQKTIYKSNIEKRTCAHNIFSLHKHNWSTLLCTNATLSTQQQKPREESERKLLSSFPNTLVPFSNMCTIISSLNSNENLFLITRNGNFYLISSELSNSKYRSRDVG